MHQLSPFTCRRLSQLPRLTSVWECDRRPLPRASQSAIASIESGAESVQGDCIMWVDSLQGVVRGLSVVPPETGHEAIVRTLLQAIEMPQGRVEPARPRKVVVRDREIQFFLRGALQALDIPVEYTPELPVIDEVFEKLQAPGVPQVTLPKDFEEALIEKSALMWTAAPWQHLSEQEILAIELNCWEIETLYLSVLGLAGMEYGLLFYRNLASLQQFRHKLLQGGQTQEDMQQAFLEQNCLFINFNPEERDLPVPLFKSKSAPTEPGRTDERMDERTERELEMTVGYEFGSLHPLEGLRSHLAEEEAASLIVVLEALHRFFKKHDISIENFALKPITSRFRIPNPASGIDLKLVEADADKDKGQNVATSDVIAVKISTLPDVSAAFLEETLETEAATEVESAAIVDDSVPEGSLIMLGSHKEKDIEPLRSHRRVYYQSFLDQPTSRSGGKFRWPILTIQTTRPKAKQLVEQLKKEGGIKAICFNPGSDPLSGQVFQIGLIQTAKGQLHLFNEYEISDPTDSQALEKWTTNSAENGNCCGCIVAAGATGAKRGRPTAREVVAFFEAQTKLPEELGLTPLVMSYAPDW